MKILSLFDGISIAQQAFKELGYEVEYYASEIDKNAIQVTQKNHPNTEQLGDIKDIDCTGGKLHYGKGKLAETDIYILIGGSPCQDLSIAKKNREGLSGKRSGLFWEYVRILKELKPKYFILENVASMSKEAKQTITDTLWGIEPVMINASLVSAQNRKRLFWIGKLVGDKYERVEISQPEDKGIFLKDILEENVDEKYFTTMDFTKRFDYTIHEEPYGKKTQALRATDYKGTHNTIRIGQIGKGGQGDRIYSPEGKSVNLSANGGGRGAKTGLYLTWGVANRTRNGKKQIEHNGLEKANAMTSVQTDSMVDVGNVIRRLTPIECERLQSLPDNYTEGISNTQRYKALGNGFNCSVIKHILENIL